MNRGAVDTQGSPRVLGEGSGWGIDIPYVHNEGRLGTAGPIPSSFRPIGPTR